MTPIFLQSASRYVKGLEFALGNLPAPISVAPVANQAYYVPFTIPWPYPCKRLWVRNGTALAGNVDIGIFAANGAKIISTGAVSTGAATNNFNFISASFLLPPGSYYFGVSYSSASARVMAWALSGSLDVKHAGILYQASAHPLPNAIGSVTFPSAIDRYPMMGMTKMSSWY